MEWELITDFRAMVQDLPQEHKEEQTPEWLEQEWEEDDFSELVLDQRNFDLDHAKDKNIRILKEILVVHRKVVVALKKIRAKPRFVSYYYLEELMHKLNLSPTHLPISPRKHSYSLS